MKIYCRKHYCRNFSNNCCKITAELLNTELLILNSGEVVRSALKPIGEVYKATAVDTNKDVLFEAEVEPATEQEIADTVTVMGGQDWELWMSALADAGVEAPDVDEIFLGTYNGGMDPQDREEVKAAFQAHPDDSPASDQ